MKQRILLVLSAALLLIISGCSKKSTTVSSDSNSVDSSVSTTGGGSSSSTSIDRDPAQAVYSVDGGSGYLTTYRDAVKLMDTVQEGTILHAWNWSMNTIKSKMAEIAAAGYTAVQTSPLQVQKDYVANNSVKDAWWKVYQPLSLSIATDASKNQLGTKDQLKEVCAEADKYGVKVIVDVVSNHLAGANSSGSYTLHPDVKNYEPEIYGSGGTNATGAAVHAGSSSSASDNSAYSVTNGNIGGYPDLDTGSTIVQERVSSLLKEYIDCGVDGFRFDAAKHIETPSDPEDVRSDYWTKVLGDATDYAISKGEDAPYYYGEILNTVGTGRSYSYYSPLMSVTDNQTGNNVRSGFFLNTAYSTVSSEYKTGLPANKVVLWSESHDTYANDSHETTNISQNIINKGYAIVASRKDAASLFLARPTDMSSTIMGESNTDYWKSKEVTAVNKFHNYFGNANEYLGSSGDFAMNVRYDSSKCGMVLVNAKEGTAVTDVSVPTEEMKDGSYKDLVSGNTFTVSGGKVSGTMDESQIAVLCNIDSSGEQVQDAAKISMSGITGAINLYDTPTFEGVITVANAQSATIQIGSDEPIPVYNGTKLTISELDYGKELTIKLVVVDLSGSRFEQEFILTHENGAAKKTMYFTNTKKWSKVFIYMWDTNSVVGYDATIKNHAWPGVEMTYLELNDQEQQVYVYEYDSSTYNRLIFNDGSGKQTVDITITDFNGYWITGGSGTKFTVEGYNR